MNRTVRKLFVAILIVGSLGISVLAQDASEDRLVPNVLAEPKPSKMARAPKKEGFAEHLKLGVDVWNTMAEAEWSISFLGGLGRSDLEWEDVDSLVTVFHGEFTPHPMFKISGEYGMGDIDDGQNTDSDYESLWFGLGDFRFSESVASTEGETSMLNLKGHFVLSELAGFRDYPGTLDVFIGYHYYTDELQDTDGVQTEIDGEKVNIPFESEGPALDSSYDFEWQGLSWGVSATYPLLKVLEVSGSIAVIGLLDYEGEGIWNLREDFRQDPSFSHEADEGGGVDGTIALTYYPVENLGIRLGYRYTQWEAENGTDKTYFVDGTSFEADLDTVESTRHGAFIGIFGRI